MPLKLSCHWQRTHPSGDDDRWLSAWKPLHVKIITVSDNDIPGLDTALKYVNTSSGRIIVRHHPLSENFGQRGLPDPATSENIARNHVAYIKNLWNIARDRYKAKPEQLLWCGINEPQVWDKEPPAMVNRYYRRFLDELHVLGLYGMALNFGVGWPGNDGIKDAPPIWGPYDDVRKAMVKGDVLGLHEYWPKEGPTFAWRWLAGRYTQCPWDVPIIIGECGIDDMVSFSSASPTFGEYSDVWDIDQYIAFNALRHEQADVSDAGRAHYGFHGLSSNAEVASRMYFEHLAWYNEQLLKDNRVQSNMPFTYDFSHPWSTFCIRIKEFMDGQLIPAVGREGIWTTPIPQPAPTPQPTPAPIPAPTPTPTAGVPVVHIDGKTYSENWLFDTYGIKIDNSLRRASGYNWIITGIRAVQQKRYTVTVKPGEFPRAVGRTWPNAENKWPGGVKPPNVPAPPGAETRAEFGVAAPSASGYSNVDFVAGDGDMIDPPKKLGVNHFWMPTSTEGSDVLSNTGIAPGPICFVPTFEMVAVGQPAPAPQPSPNWREKVLRWEALIKKYTSFNTGIFLTLIWIESGGDPNAINKKSQATGLGQVMPREAGPSFANRPTQKELLDPETNIQWMVKIFKGDYDRYTSWTMQTERALCAYYGGAKLAENMLADDALFYLRTFIFAWTPLLGTPCPYQLPDDHTPEYQLFLDKGVWYIEEAVRNIEKATSPETPGEIDWQLIQKARNLLLNEALVRFIKLRDLR